MPRTLGTAIIMGLAAFVLAGCFVERCEWTPGAEVSDEMTDATLPDADSAAPLGLTNEVRELNDGAIGIQVEVSAPNDRESP